jgi:hypothetical protein
MPNHRRFVLLSIMAAFVLVLSAAITVPVYADGETPPVESPQQVEAEGEAEADIPLDETSNLEEGMGEEADQTLPEPDPVADEVTQSETTESILTELPADTELVVVDEEGELLPLASQEAADALSFIDPVWCPVGVTPKDGAGGCTPGYGSLYDLIFDIANNVITEPGKAGVIWIQAGADTSANPIIIDGFDPDLGSWSDFALTLQGGWNGTYGSTAIIGVSTFSQPISIINWNAPVTINNITIAGATGDGLNVATSGNIVLKNVQSNNNSGRGAFLDNTGGTGNITITNGQFNNNAGAHGLLAASKGTITLKDVTANSNTNGYGAVLTNDSAATPKAVVLSGTNTFSNNQFDGLNISTKGAVTLNNVLASGNVNGYGAQIINNVDPAVPSAVTLTGTNIFNDNNGGYGLYVATFGRVTISNLYANSNTGIGAGIVNSGGNTPQPVTLTGTSEFKYNTIFGLFITSHGAITLNNITANSNGQTGASLALSGSAVSNITLKGTNAFNDNGNTGLIVQGNNNGAIAINNITASGNGTSGSTGSGAEILFVTNVTITGLNNTFDSNYNNGLYVSARGVITLSNIKASFNGLGGGVGYGASLSNTASGPSVPKAVVLLGTNVFNSNDFDGLLINTYGAVTVNNVSASDNGQGGSSGSGAYIINSGSTNPQKVTLNGVNTFNDNMEYGLLVISKGAILASSMTANSNGFYGVFLQNNTGPVTSTVTLKGTNVFSGNVNDNLFVQAAGLITLNNIKANSSTTGSGAFISNAGSFTAGVNIFGVNEFNFNNLHGLHVQSNGAIRVNSVTANGNGAGGGHGTWLNNANSGIKAGVTVTGTNTFNDNLTGEGLFIWSLGTVRTNNLTAVSNGGRGVSIDNGTLFVLYDPIGSVIMTGANVFSGNGSHNLYIDSFGLVSLANINSTGSVNGAGASIDNTGGPAPKPVTLSGLNNVFSNNSSNSGLVILSDGAITLNNVTASNNGMDGAYLFNADATTPVGVTLLGTNTFNNNGSSGGSGLYIESRGLITTTNLTASGNQFSQGASF